MWCILLLYNSQPYIVDPYIAAYFGYLMIYDHYKDISREEKTVYYCETSPNHRSLTLKGGNFLRPPTPQSLWLKFQAPMLKLPHNFCAV